MESSGEPDCLLLFQEHSSFPGAAIPGEALLSGSPGVAGAGAGRSALSWEGMAAACDGHDVHAARAHGETGTGARSAALGIAHVHQAASLSAESAHTGAARVGEALPSSPRWYLPWIYHSGRIGQE